jgi:oligosaccharyltransferase complex subunit delta (ribophorin II)
LESYALSSESGDKLQVIVTQDGLPAQPVTVTLVSAHRVGADSAPIVSNEKFESIGDGKYTYDLLSHKLPWGKYKIKFEAKPDAILTLTSKASLTTTISITAPISVSNVQLTILDSETKLSEAGLDFSKKETVTLSASHLQKLKLTFELTLPSGAPFKAQQVFLKLQHESGVEHLYLLKLSGKRYELTLDFLGMVEKLNFLSGIYDIELIVGDDVMENPFVWTLASLDLDLPEGPDGTAQTLTGQEVSSSFGPKAEISHIFRQPEKRPPTYLSTAFLILTILPLAGFFVGLLQLGVNLKMLPSSGLPLVSALSFHGGIACILGLYFLFWLKLNLFTTLKFLGFLGLLTLVPGFNILSYLADSTTKLKAS